MRKFFVAAWVLLTFVVNVFAIAGLLDIVGIDNVDWHAPFEQLGVLYESFAIASMTTISGIAMERVGMEVPMWLIHVLVLYVSSASAIAVAGSGLFNKADWLSVFLGTGLSFLWPLAIFAFLWQAVRLRLVTRFARQHAFVLTAYILGMVAIYFIARWINSGL